MKSYDYAQRKGVEKISWDKFEKLSRILTEALADRNIEIVVGIARAGLIPAAVVACNLRCEMLPVRVTRREFDKIKYDHPVWKVDVTSDVSGKIVAVIDEISDSGETLQEVSRRVKELGALDVISASLISHSWAKPKPQITALTNDALIIFPWDREVFVNNRWQIHPEIEEALNINIDH